MLPLIKKHWLKEVIYHFRLDLKTNCNAIIYFSFEFKGSPLNAAKQHR